MGRIVGIDFGTSRSSVAVMDGGTPVVIPNQERERTTPSVVAFASGGETLVGTSARRQATANPLRTIHGVKRLMGRRFDALATRDLAGALPYDLVRSANGGVLLQIEDNLYSPPEIAAIVLGELKASAEGYLGELVDQAVVAVPSCFDAVRRRAVQDAAAIAGLEVQHFVDESTAAALHYGLDPTTNDRVVATCDLGAGHFSLSFVEARGGVHQVLATGGDSDVGGDDFDQCILKWLIDWFEGAYGIDLTSDWVAVQRLKEVAERAKLELSELPQTKIVVPFVSAQHDKRIETTLTRAGFEQMITPLVERVVSACEEAGQRAGIEASDIDEVIAIGAQTRVPAVLEKLRSVLGREIRLDVKGKEAVGLGAALLAGVWEGTIADLVLKDVTPRALGIETGDGAYTPVVERNYRIPTTQHVNLSTLPIDGRDVELHVLQGESPEALDNTSLARFVLGEVVPESGQKPTIQVTFDIDSSGALRVSAYEPWTSREQSLKVVPRGELSDDALEQARQTHEQYRRAKSIGSTLASGFGSFARLVDRTSKTLDRLSDKLTREELLQCYEALAVAAAVLKRGDDEALEAVTERVEEVAQTLDQARLR